MWWREVPTACQMKKNREGRDENIFDIDRITRIALHKTKIRGRLEGREISQNELEDMKDFLEFKISIWMTPWTFKGSTASRPFAVRRATGRVCRLP